MQFVRVERVYLPGSYNPLAHNSDPFIQNADVTLSDGRNISRLRDTLLERSDTTRYRFPIRAYVVFPFRPIRGAVYSIRVVVDGLEPTVGSVTVPETPTIELDLMSRSVIDRPTGFIKNANIAVRLRLGKGTAGYRSRLFADFEVLLGGEWLEERVEIPSAFASTGSSDLSHVSYPTIVQCPENSRAVSAHWQDVYAATLNEVSYRKYGSTRIIFNRLVVQLSQLDKNLFHYYASTHTPQDSRSIRLEQPEFYSVMGGYGTVGAYALDSLVHLLPENFPFNH